MSRESKKLKHEFNLAQVANLDLEKKVAELADAWKNAKTKKGSLKMRRRLPKMPSRILRKT
jgi:predicted  nucleic acid-binding Zn-ribbon protein